MITLNRSVFVSLLIDPTQASMCDCEQPVRDICVLENEVDNGSTSPSRNASNSRECQDPTSLTSPPNQVEELYLKAIKLEYQLIQCQCTDQLGSINRIRAAIAKLPTDKAEPVPKKTDLLGAPASSGECACTASNRGDHLPFINVEELIDTRPQSVNKFGDDFLAKLAYVDKQLSDYDKAVSVYEARCVTPACCPNKDCSNDENLKSFADRRRLYLKTATGLAEAELNLSRTPAAKDEAGTRVFRIGSNPTFTTPDNPRDHLLKESGLKNWAHIHVNGQYVYVNVETGTVSSEMPVVQSTTRPSDQQQPSQAEVKAADGPVDPVTPQPASANAHDTWAEAVDKDSGRTYLYNTATLETKWADTAVTPALTAVTSQISPQASASAPPLDCWTVQFDDTHKQYYFENDETHEYQWANHDAFAGVPAAPRSAASTPGAAPPGCWIASIDEQSKDLYFYNTAAVMSAWAAKPADLSAGLGGHLSGAVLDSQTVATGKREITDTLTTSNTDGVTIQPPPVKTSQPVEPHPILLGPTLLEEIRNAASTPLEQLSAEPVLAPSTTAADETLPGWQVITDSEGLKSYKHEATGLVSSENPKDHLLADAALHHWAEINLDGEKVFVNTKTGDKSETRPPPPPALPAPRPAHADLLVQFQHATLKKKNSIADAVAESKPASRSILPGQLTLADQIAAVKLQRTAINGPNKAPAAGKSQPSWALATLRKTDSPHVAVSTNTKGEI